MVSNLPEDTCVNTWHFTCIPADTPTLEEVSLALRDFYGTPLPSHWSSDVKATGWTVRFYDLADLKPRAPIYETGWSLPSVPSGEPMPHELAACVSFMAPK